MGLIRRENWLTMGIDIRGRALHESAVALGAFAFVSRADESDGEDFSGLLLFLLKVIGAVVGLAVALLIVSLVVMVPLLRALVWLKNKRLAVRDRRSFEEEGTDE